MIINQEEYIEHFGIKGMRWGVHREKVNSAKSEYKSARKAQKKLKKDIKKFNKRKSRWIDAYNDATDIFNSKINDLNNKYLDVDFKDSKNKKQYEKYNKEAAKLWSDSYKEMAINIIGKDPVTKGYEYIDKLPFMHMYD